MCLCNLPIPESTLGKLFQCCFAVILMVFGVVHCQSGIFVAVTCSHFGKRIWHVIIIITWVSISFPFGCLYYLGWPWALNPCLWLSYTLRAGWHHLHWVTLGQILVVWMDASCILGALWIAPSFPVCQMPGVWTFVHLQYERQISVLVIPFPKNGPYSILLDKVGSVTFYYGSILIISINGLKTFIKFWKVYKLVSCE